MNFKFALLPSVLFILISCSRGEKENYTGTKLTLEKEIKIQENEANYLNFIRQAIPDEVNNQLVCITDSRKISTIDISSGKVSSYFELTDSLVSVFHRNFKNRNPNLTFLNEKIDSTAVFTAKIGRMWFDKKSNALFVNFEFQFDIEGSYGADKATIRTFFEVNNMISNGAIKETYYLTDVQKINKDYSEKNDENTVFYTAWQALYANEKYMLCGLGYKYLTDTSSLLTHLELKNDKISVNKFLKVFPNPKIHRRKDHIFTSFTFVERKDNLYFTDCRSLFDLKTNERTDLITDKTWSVLDFKFLDDSNILAYQKCDTNKQNEIGIYEIKNNKSTYIPLSKFEKTFFTFSENNIYEIKKVEDSYYLRTYKIE